MDEKAIPRYFALFQSRAAIKRTAALRATPVAVNKAPLLRGMSARIGSAACAVSGIPRSLPRTGEERVEILSMMCMPGWGTGQKVLLGITASNSACTIRIV